MGIGTIIIIVVIIGIVGWVYNAGHKTGKREGSRKGYGVGFDRGRRSLGGQNGCAIILAVGAAATIGTIALAILE
jgi:hypothetical protein